MYSRGKNATLLNKSGTTEKNQTRTVSLSMLNMVIPTNIYLSPMNLY